MTADHFRYHRAWRLYLDAIAWSDYCRDRDCEHFLDGLGEYLGRSVSVLRWPEVWPNVEWLFGGEERFVEAVERYRDRMDGNHRVSWKQEGSVT